MIELGIDYKKKERLAYIQKIKKNHRARLKRQEKMKEDWQKMTEKQKTASQRSFYFQNI